MTKTDLINFIAAETGKQTTDNIVKLWAELARLKVAGDHDWRRLKHFDTLTTVANVRDYILPDKLGGTLKPLIDRLIAIRGQADTDDPLRFFTPDQFIETVFDDEAEAVCIRKLGGSPGSGLSAGQMEIRLAATPTSAKTFDVLLKLPPATDSLDFVPLNNHSVFCWAGLAFAYSKAQIPNEAGGFQNAAGMYVQEMAQAVKNDYPSPKEEDFLLPVQRWLDFRTKTVEISAGR